MLKLEMLRKEIEELNQKALGESPLDIKNPKKKLEWITNEQEIEMRYSREFRSEYDRDDHRPFYGVAKSLFIIEAKDYRRAEKNARKQLLWTKWKVPIARDSLQRSLLMESQE